MKHNKIRVTTTSGFEGAEIVTYLEPVTAHSVVGMNFFKDLFSSITDIFGGKSSSYQSTLESINREVIDQLRLKAQAMGGNCVVGMKVDNDEISAQGKSMLMVTAVGTVAIAKFTKEQEESHLVSKGELNLSTFETLEKKGHYLVQAKSETLKFNSEFWEFVIKHAMHEFAAPILKRYEKGFENYIIGENFETRLPEYFAQISPSLAKEALYSLLLRTENSSTEIRFVINLINDLALLSYSNLTQLIRSSNGNIKKLSLSLLQGKKNGYAFEDLKKMEVLHSLIEIEFPITAQFTTKKKALTTKEKEIWVCECSKENNADNTHCSKCSKDIYGFASGELNPKEALKIISNTQEVLKQYYSD